MELNFFSKVIKLKGLKLISEHMKEVWKAYLNGEREIRKTYIKTYLNVSDLKLCCADLVYYNDFKLLWE